ncbi:c2h2 finger domain containing protein [Grosmannia clavigera kw1407]|uniref:C2h2 finger domain containing protein n=1 Tax=Grosmannia clavigera (strain kw1407 / UAMH 11150) TaxID=655863 RepID=F0X994_GROCL|nr:c2h2 finger domain containing protein [Grosmannia clavigera kw1407]EFX05758.1 c2h2 finger domain containing protein [Grosmannia clavigera kw1407]
MMSGRNLIQPAYFDQPAEAVGSIGPGVLPAAPGAPTAVPMRKGAMCYDNYVHSTQNPGTGNSLQLDAGSAATALVSQTLFSGTADVGIMPAQQTAMASDEPQPIVARTSSGDIRGIVLPGAIYYRRAGYTFPQRRYAILLDDPIAETECGAEIFELGTAHVYGYVVHIGRYSRVQVVYAVAVADGFWDVSSRFDEETRNATLWYDRQPRALPLCLGTIARGEGARMGHSMAAEASSPAFIIQTPVMQEQSSFGYGSSNEPGFIMPAASSATGPSSAKPSLGSPIPTLASMEDSTAMARPGHKKDCQVQFVHYRGISVDGERPVGLLGKLDTESDGEQHCLPLLNDEMADQDTSINELLPDKKCPFQTCPYHKKGFARKHDLVRHVITHYDGQLYCGFCPDELAKSFGRPFLRVEPLKRHLAVVHHAAKFRKTQNTTETYLKLRLKEYGAVHGGHCNICSRQFSVAAKLYNHIEGCVVRLLLERARAGDIEPQESEELSGAQLGWSTNHQASRRAGAKTGTEGDKKQEIEEQNMVPGYDDSSL